MTPHDDVQDRLARLAQRQDQLERQQRDTNRSVEVLRRDADSGIENLRWNTDLRLKDMEWNADLRLKDLEQRVASLERFRDFVESLIMHAIMIGCGVALTILIVIIVVEARGGRQENGQLEERSLISLRVAPGDQVQPGLSPAAQIPPPRHWATSKMVADELGSFTESLSPKRAGLKDERILGLAYPLVRVHYGGPVFAVQTIVRGADHIDFRSFNWTQLSFRPTEALLPSRRHL